jgi:tRNA-modifying protein YgfZ
MSSADGYRTLTTGAALVRRTDLGVLRVSGADRTAWLQGLVTNDVQALQPRQACYAAYLTPQGRMISDMRVVALADALLLDVPASLSASLGERLDALIFAEDVQVGDDSGTTAIVELYGPRSGEVVARTDPKGEPVVPSEQYGLPAWVVHVPRERVPSAVDVLTRQGVDEVSLEALEVVRLEAGIPKFLVDMDEHTIPLEAGIEDRAISFTKGCYVGQELIVRVRHRGGGRVARRLVGLALEGTTGPSGGDPIVGDGREVGTVTSAAASPTLGRHIALGYVHRDFVEPGTAVEIVRGDHRLRATVAALPFVRRAT